MADLPPTDLNIKFRLHQDVSEENQLRLVQFVKTLLSDRYIVAGEVDAHRPHFQCYICLPLLVGEDGDLKKALKRVRNSFRYQYKDLLDTLPAGKKGNSLYSITLVEQNSSFPLEYCAYLLKENCLDFVGFSEEERLLIIEHNNAVLGKIQSKLVKKKQSQIAMVEEALESRLTEVVDEEGFKTFHIDTLGLRQSGSLEPLSEYLIALFVVDYWKINYLPVREFHMVSIVQTLSLKFLPHYRGTLVDRILEKVNKN